MTYAEGFWALLTQKLVSIRLQCPQSDHVYIMLVISRSHTFHVLECLQVIKFAFWPEKGLCLVLKWRTIINNVIANISVSKCRFNFRVISWAHLLAKGAQRVFVQDRSLEDIASVCNFLDCKENLYENLKTLQWLSRNFCKESVIKCKHWFFFQHYHQ